MRGVVAAGVLAASLIVAAPAQAQTPVPPAGWHTAVLELSNTSMEVDPTRDVLLVGVRNTVPTLGNHVVEVDPQTGAIGRSVLVTGGIGRIAVSDDGTRAYVALFRGNQIVEIDLESFTVVRRIDVYDPELDGEAYVVGDLEVQPGRSDVVVAVRRNRCCAPGNEGLVAFEDGERLPVEAGSYPYTDRIAFGADPSTLYGFGNGTDNFPLNTYRVDSNGVDLIGTEEAVLAGFGDDMEYDAGRLTTTSGFVADPVTGTRLGRYEAFGAVEVQPAIGAAWFADNDHLERFDTTTFQRVATLTTDDEFDNARTLVTTGAGLAAATPSTVVLIGGAVTDGGFNLPDPPPTILRVDDATTIPLTAWQVEPSSDGHRLFAVTHDSDSQGQSLVEVDATTGQRLRHLQLADNPFNLSVSDDDTTAVIGHVHTNHVTEVDLETFTVRREVDLPDVFRDYVIEAGNVEMVPGTNDRYVVELSVRDISPRQAGMIEVIRGVIQPDRTPGHTSPDSIAFGDDPTSLYGYNGWTTQFGFWVIDVDDEGVRFRTEVDRLLEGFGVEIEAEGDLVYATDGSIIDPTGPRVIGAFPAGGLPAPVPDQDRAFLGTNGAVVEVELASQSLVAVHDLPIWAFDADIVGPRLAVAAADTLTIIPFGSSVPTAPRRVQAARDDSEVTVTWRAPRSDGGAPISAYLVLRDGTQVHEAAATDRSWVDTAPGNATSYTVRAVNAEGEGTESAPATVVDDAGDPTIEVTVPAPNAVYDLAQVVAADYRCLDEDGGSGIAECQGPVDDDVPIDTSTVGAHTFRIVAEDGAGHRTVETVTYRVRPVYCAGRRATVVWGLGQRPTSGDDVIVGTPREDTIDGGAGDDVICGGGRSDVIRGGPGADRIEGAQGNNYLRGGAGADRLLGGRDSYDNIRGGPGADRIEGRGGQDSLEGEGGPDVLAGGPDSDYLDGGPGDDRLNGGDGSDTCKGSSGVDAAVECEQATGIP